MNHQLRIRSTGNFYQPLSEVGVTRAGTFREPAEGFSTTGAGSCRRASRTDSVNRGSSISLFTLASVVLALLTGFFLFCIVKFSHGSFAESVLNSSHGVLIEVHGFCRGLVLPIPPTDWIATNFLNSLSVPFRYYGPTCLQPRMLFSFRFSRAIHAELTRAGIKVRAR
jgi:hypothetical protein